MYEFVQLSQWQASIQLAVSLISKRIFIGKQDRTHNWWRQLEKQKQLRKGKVGGGGFNPIWTEEGGAFNDLHKIFITYVDQYLVILKDS